MESGGVITSGFVLLSVSQPAQRDEDHRFTEQYSDEDFLDAVESLELPTSKDVHEAVGCSYSLADYRLKELEKEDRVSKQKVASANIWSVVE